MARFAILCVALSLVCIGADPVVLTSADDDADDDAGFQLDEAGLAAEIGPIGIPRLMRAEEPRPSDRDSAKLASVLPHRGDEWENADEEDATGDDRVPGQKRTIPRMTRMALKELLANQNNISYILEQRGPIIVTDALVRPEEWRPSDPVCSTGNVTFGHQVQWYLQELTQGATPEQRLMLDSISKAAHNQTFQGLLNTLLSQPSVPWYENYADSLDGAAFDPGSLQPDFPDLEAEIARYVSMPLSAHDVPMHEFCPGRKEDWSPSKLLGFDSGFNTRKSNIFWGPRGSQPYPMHINEHLSLGPIMKFVTKGRQEVAIFPRSEAGKLLPLRPSDAEDPRPTAVFRVDALSPPEEAAHFGDYIHANGWRDEVDEGEILFFLGGNLHQFKNPVQSFSVIYFI